MTSLQIVESRDDAWREVLAAAVRDEFRVDIYFPRPDDRILFGEPCSVGRCGRAGTTYASDGLRLCHGHWTRWRKDGRPLAEWVPNAAPLKREAFARECRVDGCPRSSMAKSMCRTHYNRARDAPERTVEEFLADPGPQPPSGPDRCLIADCDFPTHPRSKFCDRHEQAVRSRLARLPRAEAEQGVIEGSGRGLPRYNLRANSSVTRDELRFLLQAIGDEMLSYRWHPSRWRELRKLYAVTGADSLLDMDLDAQDHELLVDCSARRLRRALEAARRQATGESGRDSDVWHRELYECFAHDSQGDKPTSMDFTRIRAPWLRALVKDVTWHRMAAQNGVTPVTAWRLAHAIIRFEQWAGDRLRGPGDITRRLLLDYLAYVHGQQISGGERNIRLQAIKTFVETVRALDLAPIPQNAGYLRNEWADRRREETARYFEDREIAQLDDPTNRAKLDPVYNRAVEVLRHTGFRISSLVRLKRDALSGLARKFADVSMVR